MAGIYIHIPFCRQKCYYCDFYKTVNTSLSGSFAEALKSEMVLRKSYLEGQSRINTVYFGGGTPSVLDEKELEVIMAALHDYFDIAEEAEISFEANPDDLSRQYLTTLKKNGINRLSIGIQSFNDQLLSRMNRRHNAQQAVECIEEARNAGFENLSTDLIYGLPGLEPEEWKRNLDKMLRLPIEHLSAYHLTYHEGTAFNTWLKKGTLKAADEADSVEQFDILMNETEKFGFEQYEISNFARNASYSKHNSAYWKGTTYLGLGPSAHSYNGYSRQWNVAHVESYLRSIQNKQDCYELEALGIKDRYNEYILTRIRTKWGVSEQEIVSNFGEEYARYFLKSVRRFVHQKLVNELKGVYTLPKKGMFVSDDIMTALIMV